MKQEYEGKNLLLEEKYIVLSINIKITIQSKIALFSNFGIIN